MRVEIKRSRYYTDVSHPARKVLSPALCLVPALLFSQPKQSLIRFRFR
jgi:hypothetical protein